MTCWRRRNNSKMLTGATLALLASPLIFFIAVRYFSFPKQPKKRVDSFLAKTGTGIFAHRGGRPENTLSAMRKSHQQGAIGVEVDLAFSRDGKPVLVHDSTLDRTSSGCGGVSDFSLAELKAMDFGTKSGGEEFAGEPIPTLQEAVELCKELDLLMFLELKEKADKSAETVRELFASDPSLYTRIAVISFYPHILYRVRQVDSNALVGLVSRNNVLCTTPDGAARDLSFLNYCIAVVMDKVLAVSIRTWLWDFLGVSLLVANKEDIKSKRIDPEVWKERGVQLVAWTVNNAEEKVLFRDNLQIPFMSDNVAWDVSVSEQSN